MDLRTTIAAFLLGLPLLSGCGDSISSVQAQSAELSQIQEQLETVLQRLDAIEESRSEEVAGIEEALAAIGTTVNDLALGAGASVGASAAVEGSICAKSSLGADANYEALFALRGQGDGMLGVDAYGNGGNATLRAYLQQKLNASVKPGTSLEMQLCGKLTGQTGVDGGVSIDATDPVIALLQDLTSSVGTSQLASAAATMDMNGMRSGQALDALSSLSPSGLASSFSGGGGPALVGALPLPPDMRALMENPRGLLSEAGPVASSSVDLLCDPALQVGEFAALLSSGCDLRDQVPPPADVIDVIGNLESFHTSLNTLESSFASLESTVGGVCSTLTGVTGQNLHIPSRSVTILGTSYTTFPGYSAPLFPSLGAPSGC